MYDFFYNLNYFVVIVILIIFTLFIIYVINKISFMFLRIILTGIFLIIIIAVLLVATSLNS